MQSQGLHPAQEPLPLPPKPHANPLVGRDKPLLPTCASIANSSASLGLWKASTKLSASQLPS